MVRGWSGDVQGMCWAEGFTRLLLLEGIFVSKHCSKKTHPCVFASIKSPGFQGAEQSSFYHSKHLVLKPLEIVLEGRRDPKP